MTDVTVNQDSNGDLSALRINTRFLVETDKPRTAVNIKSHRRMTPDSWYISYPYNFHTKA